MKTKPKNKPIEWLKKRNLEPYIAYKGPNKEIKYGWTRESNSLVRSGLYKFHGLPDIVFEFLPIVLLDCIVSGLPEKLSHGHWWVFYKTREQAISDFKEAFEMAISKGWDPNDS